MNYLPKKSFLKGSIIIMVLFAFVMPQHLGAQVSSTLIGSGPKGGQNVQWKSIAEGIQITQQQIDLLDAALNALKQQSADAKLIGKTSTELQYYQLILQGLQSGKPLWLAVQDAYATVGGGTDNAADHPYMSLAELQAMYDTSVSKLSL